MKGNIDFMNTDISVGKISTNEKRQISNMTISTGTFKKYGNRYLDINIEDEDDLNDLYDVLQNAIAVKLHTGDLNSTINNRILELSEFIENDKKKYRSEEV
jgi:hypothetical protein